MMTSPLVLVKASPAQQSQADNLTYPIWGAPSLTLQEYLEREAKLSASDFAKETLTGYVLVPKDNPLTTDILCYVEVFRRPCRYADKTFIGYSIGSVFTPEIHRKQGYASIMLAQLTHLMKSEQGDEGIVISNLYSDIGPTYYAKKGWKIHSSAQLTFPVDFQIENSMDSQGLLPVDTDTILSRICTSDIKHMEPLVNSTSVYFDLTPAAVKWFQVRSDFYAKTKTSFPSPPQSVGIYLNPAASDALVSEYLLWTHDFKSNQLTILRCHISATYFSAFLQLALAEAKRWNLTCVCFWGASPYLQETYPDLVVVRDDALPSLMAPSEVSWLGNEKYVWI